jgi:hypothetical protein
MILRRLIAWFRRSQPLRSQKAPEPANDGAAFDLDEFGRLLNSGKNRRPSKNRTCPKPAGKRPEQVVSTKSRQVIFGSRIRGAKIRAEGAREEAAKAIRAADRAKRKHGRSVKLFFEPALYELP